MDSVLADMTSSMVALMHLVVIASTGHMVNNPASIKLLHLDSSSQIKLQHRVLKLLVP